MPIVRFTNRFSEVPAAPVNFQVIAPGFNLATTEEGLSDTDRKYPRKDYGPYANYTYDKYTGLCLRDREANGYHDSDFHMLIWDAEAGKPFEICFASTRGWSYPSYASKVDATPEVRAAYDAYTAAQARRNSICRRWAERRNNVTLARAIGEPNYTKLTKLTRIIPHGKRATVEDLLTNPRIRSAFKKSLKAQILSWYANPEPKFDNPLSRKQWEYV